MIEYPVQPETTVTAAEVRLLRRLLALLSSEQLEQMAVALEDVCRHGQGTVTVKIYRGHGRFVERTYTDSLDI